MSSLHTLRVHSGTFTDSHGAVMPPIYATSTFAQPAPGQHTGYEYSRSGNPTRHALETAIADLENGTRGYAFASGLAAISTVLELLDKDSHLGAVDDVYGGTYRLLENVRRRSAGLQVSWVKPDDLAGIEAAIRPDTRMIWVETPTNPLLKLADLSAIAAIAPVIEATDMDIAYGMSATFLFDTIMVVVFPLLGRAMSLSDAAFGLWAGTAVNDTSSVVATGYAFSEAAGDFATMVKLTRTLAIIPTVLVFAAISVHLKKKAAAQSGDHGVKVNMKSVFPWFILGFLAMSILCSVGVIPAGLAATLKSISKFLMVAALAAIGLNTNFAALCKSGAKPMLHGFIISLLVVLVAIAVEYVLGIAPSGTLI